MKAVSLVSGIILSISVILLLSMGVQATEYKEVDTEVNASSISKHIENGDDIYHDNCHIFGELNISKIKLETVPNQDYNELVNEGFETETITEIGISENFPVIKSNITIKNSIFEDNFNFSDVIFHKSVEFSGVDFNNSVDFGEATFSDSANFEGAIFNSLADFRGVTFNSFANFDRATFNSDVIFWGTIFNSDANFWEVTFNDSAGFGGAIFNDSDFGRATFNSNADFEVANFNSSAGFDRVIFNSDVIFWGAIFNSYADFWGTTFNDSAIFSVPETSENIITDRKTCDFFMRFYNNEARYIDADNIYYEPIPKLKIASLNRVFRIINPVSNHENNPENS